LLGIIGPLSAQVKIGYANVNAILSLMPETKTIAEELQAYEAKLGEKLRIKQDYAQAKYQEYLELTEDTENPPTEEQLKPLEDELNRLQQEIQKEQGDGQQKLQLRRQDKMEPIIEKVQKSIKKVADAGNYTYVLNTMDGSGVSIILHAPEEHDLTEKILNDLGITIPDELKALSDK